MSVQQNYVEAFLALFFRMIVGVSYGTDCCYHQTVAFSLYVGRHLCFVMKQSSSN